MKRRNRKQPRVILLSRHSTPLHPLITNANRPMHTHLIPEGQNALALNLILNSDIFYIILCLSQTGLVAITELVYQQYMCLLNFILKLHTLHPSDFLFLVQLHFVQLQVAIKSKEDFKTKFRKFLFWFLLLVILQYLFKSFNKACFRRPVPNSKHW